MEEQNSNGGWWVSQHLFTAGTGRDLAGEKSQLIFGGSTKGKKKKYDAACSRPEVLGQQKIGGTLLCRA